MSFKTAYISVIFMAFTVAVSSFSTGDLDFNLHISALNRYEFFTGFLYLSTVFLIANAPDFRHENEIGLPLGLSRAAYPAIKNGVLFGLPTLVVFISIFITA